VYPPTCFEKEREVITDAVDLLIETGFFSTSTFPFNWETEPKNKSLEKY
jgi:hypothetical protein